MGELALLKNKIEEIRQQLNEASERGISDEKFYKLSIQIDEMIEEYLEYQENE